jgi:hypothetical protein
MIWNKVSEQMPDDEMEVLVFCEEADDMYLAWHDSSVDCWLAEHHGRIDGVTHWMEVIPPEVKP